MPTARDDAELAEAIAAGETTTVADVAAIAGRLRDVHRVAPIAPMLGAAARRALAGEWSRADHVALAKTLRDHQQLAYARRLLRRVEPADDGEYLLQQRALCTYKDLELPAIRRLDGAISILLEGRRVDEIESAETLGILGAIYKRRWEVDARQADLERARACYERGFQRVGDGDRWYAGINAAFVADQLAALADDEIRRGYGASDVPEKLRTRAQEIRTTIVDNPPADEWAAATLGEASFGLGDVDAALGHLRTAGSNVKDLWKRETTAMQLAALGRLRGIPVDVVDEALRALVGDRAGALQRAHTGKVGLALSGGGFRASLFHLGVLARLAECDALRRVEVLSCVSGGSIVGAFYYLRLRELLRDNADGVITPYHYVKLVDDVATEFLDCVRTNLRRKLFANVGKDLRMMMRRGYSRTSRTAELLQELFYSNIENDVAAGPWLMSQLMVTPSGEPDGFSLRYENWTRMAPVPMLIINATTLNTGHSWQFTASWMGEPPPGRDEPVDATRRLRRIYYADGLDAPELGTAVSASACVPMLFAPVKLSGLYEVGDGARELEVELVDGGVHDNQGIGGLAEQDCAVMLVSDASGLLDDQSQPSRSTIRVAWRAQNVLMSRVRGAQITELAGRMRAGTLRGLMMVHLKKGLPTPPREPRDPLGRRERYDPLDDPLAPGTKAQRPNYAIHADVQRALSELRTDLDRFSDAEALALMAAGYAMTRTELAESLNDMFPEDPALVDAASWQFESTVDKLAEARTADALGPGKVLFFRHLHAWWKGRAPRTDP